METNSEWVHWNFGYIYLLEWKTKISSWHDQVPMTPSIACQEVLTCTKYHKTSTLITVMFLLQNKEKLRSLATLQGMRPGREGETETFCLQKATWWGWKSRTCNAGCNQWKSVTELMTSQETMASQHTMMSQTVMATPRRVQDNSHLKNANKSRLWPSSSPSLFFCFYFLYIQHNADSNHQKPTQNPQSSKT